jgi:hypothetical protein
MDCLRASHDRGIVRSQRTALSLINASRTNGTGKLISVLVAWEGLLAFAFAGTHTI